MLYFSRKLTDSEQQYSCMEHEALAVVWCMERASIFIYFTK